MHWKEGANLLVQTFRLDLESQLLWIPETWFGDMRSSGLASGEKSVVTSSKCHSLCHKNELSLRAIGQRHLPVFPLCYCCGCLNYIGYLTALKLIWQFTSHRSVAFRCLYVHKILLLANGPFEGFYTFMMVDILNLKLDRGASATSIVESYFPGTFLLKYNLQI